MADDCGPGAAVQQMLRIATKVEGSPGKSPTVLFGISS